VSPARQCTDAFFGPSLVSSWPDEGFPSHPVHPTSVINHRLSFLFSKLKIVMKGTRFEALSSVQQTVTKELEEKVDEAFSRAFDSLYERCKRAEVGENYIEW
jgi:hypothetical protein